MSSSQQSAPIAPSLGIVFFSATVGVLGLGLGILILALQCFLWVKLGVWHPIPSTEIAIAFGGKLALWAHNPADWVGLHAFLAWLPLSFVALVVGFLAMCNADDESVARRLAIDASLRSDRLAQ